MTDKCHFLLYIFLFSLFPPFSTLDEVKLKEKGRAFHDLFLTKVSANPITQLFTVVFYLLIQSKFVILFKEGPQRLYVFICKSVKTIPVRFGLLLIVLRLYGIPSSYVRMCSKLFDMRSSLILSFLLVDSDKIVLYFSVVTTAERDRCCASR